MAQLIEPPFMHRMKYSGGWTDDFVLMNMCKIHKAGAMYAGSFYVETGIVIGDAMFDRHDTFSLEEIPLVIPEDLALAGEWHIFAKEEENEVHEMALINSFFYADDSPNPRFIEDKIVSIQSGFIGGFDRSFFDDTDNAGILLDTEKLDKASQDPFMNMNLDLSNEWTSAISLAALSGDKGIGMCYDTTRNTPWGFSALAPSAQPFRVHILMQEDFVVGAFFTMKNTYDRSTLIDIFRSTFFGFSQLSLPI